MDLSELKISHRDKSPNLGPSLVRESFQQERQGLLFPDDSSLQVIYVVALVLPYSQTQPTDHLAILDTVHVQWLCKVLRTGGRSWMAVLLVLRQQTDMQTGR